MTTTMKTWHTYASAARRVRSTERTIHRWRADGMPMTWRVTGDGTRERVVEESILLEWWREKLKASPAAYYRRRRIARERGLPDPERPERSVVRSTRAHDAGDAAESDSDDVAPDAEWIREQARARREAWHAVLEANRLSAGGPEYWALQEALRHETPACDGVTAFTDTAVDVEHHEQMEAICWRCPVRDLCAAFADVAQPAGFWAGQRR
ncbi:hypothetical protein [Microbacterium sp. NPDC077184]|uniref:hypothetical protein n=1 Tax=Microbacterium sp. NPDC077184 TaxID=3154764 RepID=UPI00341A5A8D